MTVSSFGGVNTSVIGFTDAWVHIVGVGRPTGRNSMLNGHSYALVYAMGAYVAGRGASRSVSLGFESAGGTGTFGVGSAGQAVDTGGQPCSFLTEGGTDNFRITANGSFYFGRGGSGGPSSDSHGTSFSNVIYGYYGYYSAPTPPTAPGVSSSGSTSAAVVWSAPSDNGDAAISGYRLDYSTDVTFATGVTSTEVGNVTSATVTGLTPSSTYYFRILAENAATVAATSWSLPSSTVSVLMGTAPTAPGTPTLLPFAGRLQVDWAAPSSGVPTTYSIDVSTDNTFATGVTTKTVSGALTEATFTGLTPGSSYYARVRATNGVGTGSNSTTSASSAIPARSALGLVRGAAVDISGGYQVELRSDGANSPTVTLGYIALGSSTFTSIATITIDGTSANHGVDGSTRDLALVADPTGNLYVIGRRGDDGSTVLVKYFARTATAAWAAPTSTSQALTSTGDALIEFAAQYVPGTGGSPVASILLLARRAGTLTAGSLSYATLSVPFITAGTGTQLFIASGSDPSFLGLPPSSGANTGLVDVALLQTGGTRLALLGNSWAVVDVANGVVTGVVADSAGANKVGIGWARILGVSSTAFALLTVASGGVLSWSFYSTSGSLLGSGTYAAANAFGGAFSDQWDAYTNTVANVVTVYYITSTAGARSLSSINVSPTTYAAAAAVSLTTTLGATSSTNGAIRVPEGYNDERQTTVTAANLLTGTKSSASFSDTNGNVAPNAPVLVPTSGFDATQAFIFNWADSDPNPADTQLDYELQVKDVALGTNTVATGTVASAATSYTVVANTLTNAKAYQWRVRTTDALGATGAWSAYSSFSTAALGTLTITVPATDDAAGVNTSSVAITWTYSQVNGYVQTQRRLLVTKTSDSSTFLDTTMQASTSGTYTITGLASDTEYLVTLSIITNAPGTPTVTTTRLIKPSFAAPDTPTLTLTPTATTLLALVVNPTPTGSRPTVVENDLYRRVSGSGAPFVRVAKLGANTSYNDHAVASGVAYDYYVAAISNAIPATSSNSGTVVGTGPALLGVVVFDPTAPDSSEAIYLYAKARTETLGITTAKTQLIGRVNPLVEYGAEEELVLAFTAAIPIDGLHNAAVQYLRKLYENRRAFCYRDNRGRKQYSAITSNPQITDMDTGGSEVTISVDRVDFSEAV